MYSLWEKFWGEELLCLTIWGVCWSWLLYSQCFSYCILQPSSGNSLFSIISEFKTEPFIQFIGWIVHILISMFRWDNSSVNTHQSYLCLCCLFHWTRVCNFSAWPGPETKIPNPTLESTKSCVLWHRK